MKIENLCIGDRVHLAGIYWTVETITLAEDKNRAWLHPEQGGTGFLLFEKNPLIGSLDVVD